MSDAIKIMMMGGHTENFHEFSKMGPIYEEFLTEAGFDVTLTEDRDDFTADRIAPYDVIMDYTTGGDLTEEQRTGLLSGIVKGKGFIPIHSAADSFKQTEGYIPMVGGKFLTHPAQQPHRFHIEQPDHPTMAGLEDFEMVEELYLMETCGHFELLMSARFRGVTRPITWVKGYGLGKVFYTALGHGVEQTRNAYFQRMIVNAVHWVHSEE